MLEDGLDLQPQLFLGERHEPRRLVNRPLLPRPAIQPDLGTRARSRLAVQLFDGRVDRFLAHAMRAVRIRQIAGHEDLTGLHLSQQLADDLHVGGPDRVLAHLARLIERKIEEACRGLGETHRLEAAHRLGLPDDALDVLHLRNVHLTGALVVEEVVHLAAEILHARVVDPVLRSKTLEKVHVPSHVMIEDRDVAAGHIGDDHLVLVLHELVEDTAHRDDVVVRVRRKADDALMRGQLRLSTNLGAQHVEHLAVDLAG